MFDDYEPYAVVFEDSSGNLTWSTYISETQYRSIKHPGRKPLRIGVSVDEAKDLCRRSRERGF